MPARFDDFNVLLDIRLASGEMLNFYTDSGGGHPILKKSAVERLGLPFEPKPDPELGDDAGVTYMPALDPALLIPPMEGEVCVVTKPLPLFDSVACDGMLPNGWFGGHIWTWDYPNRVFTLEGKNWQPPESAPALPLRFRAAQDGARENNFPSLHLEIDGEEIPMLFDTGARTLLTPHASQTLADGRSAGRATSFIVASIFEKWRAAHPDWRIVENAEAGTSEPMILVPDVVIAGLSAGPTWFTRRADHWFHEWLSAEMAEKIDGAIGGHALRRFAITADYPAARAWLT